MDASVTPSVRVKVSGARGESFADVARRAGSINGVPVPPNASDADVIAILTNSVALQASLYLKSITNAFEAWEAPTGTLSRATFDTATVTHEQLAQRVAALITDLKKIGTIGTEDGGLFATEDGQSLNME